jgi:glycosyltransferase involved in cell wall biosynthesis
VERRVLIIVQNLPVPFDRRVWLECHALISAGYRVAVVCPKGRGDEVTVVCTGPDLRRPQPSEADTEQRRGRQFLIAYIGVMGPQDGVDVVVPAANIVANKLGRDDIAFTLIGSWDCFNDLVALRDEFGLAGHVEFTGRTPDELVGSGMSQAGALDRLIQDERAGREDSAKQIWQLLSLEPWYRNVRSMGVAA